MPISTVTYPLGAPTVTGTTITVDMLLSQPGRINKRLSDLTLQKFIVDKVFQASGADTRSGAIIFDQVTKNYLYSSRDVEQRGPTDEYPIVQGERGEPKVALSEDWGGKFAVSDEARSRNDRRAVDDDTTQLSNTLVRKINTRAVATLEAGIAALNGAGVVAGHDWSSAITTGTSPTPVAQQPIADFTNVQLAADVEELGVEYKLWLINPIQKAALVNVYGADWKEMLAAVGESGIEIFASNRVPAGSAYAVDPGQVGFVDYEKQLTTETWREPKNRTSWVQSYVMPIMGVTNPYAVKKITGLGG